MNLMFCLNISIKRNVRVIVFKYEVFFDIWIWRINCWKFFIYEVFKYFVFIVIFGIECVDFVKFYILFCNVRYVFEFFNLVNYRCK